MLNDSSRYPAPPARARRLPSVLRSPSRVRHASRIGTLESRVIDGSSHLLEESYRLRYQVYCVERAFLSASDYPAPFETDRFDEHSVHVGAIDSRGRLAGTARLILPYADRLPTLDYSPFPLLARPLWGDGGRWVEASRLSVSRSYGGAVRHAGRTPHRAAEVERGPVFLAVLKALYQASKGIDATHWIVSIEPSLQRLLTRAGFPFRQAGPAFDYLGVVAPYSLDLSELEHVIATGRYPALADFVAGTAAWKGPLSLAV
jgi:N-acyl amino acid synthase of PEP-CTERM/exosortase system